MKGQTPAIVTIATFSLFLALTSHFILKSPIQGDRVSLTANVVSSYSQEKTNSELVVSVNKPVRLKIPTINVDATIEYVGVAPDGTMDVPKDPAPVAWFELGPIPGEIGSAVIDGHSGWKDGVKAVFNNLDKLNIGDKIYIEDEFGTTTTFVVQKVKTYDPKADASSVFSSSDGKAHLNLITCVGFWDAVNKDSSNRLVVFTDKE
jgi:LPXTG-site transpeptidase (sortase) family protein